MKLELPNGSQNHISSTENVSSHGSALSPLFEMQPQQDIVIRKARVLNSDLVLVP